MQAILRRAYAYAKPADLVDCGGGAVLDLGAGVVKNGETTVELTKNELRFADAAGAGGAAPSPGTP